jgi:hypothetical protein
VFFSFFFSSEVIMSLARCQNPVNQYHPSPARRHPS